MYVIEVCIIFYNQSNPFHSKKKLETPKADETLDSPNLSKCCGLNIK